MIDTAACVNDTVYRLGFQSLADLAANAQWLIQAELYQFADDAVRRLSYEVGLFIGYDNSITAVAGTAVYNLPASHVFTLAAWLDQQPLRITTVRDLWALDGTWSLTTGLSKRCSMDAGSVGTITLYPNPELGGTLAQICQEFPATISALASTVQLPSVLQDYLTYAQLAAARGKESQARMEEMAAHYGQRMAMYEQIMEHLWGAGQ